MKRTREEGEEGTNSRINGVNPSLVGVGRGTKKKRPKREEKQEEEEKEVVKRRWPSSPLARSRGRASHEDCCAAARDPTGVGRAGFEPPSQAEPSQPELYGTRSCRGAERGPLVPGSPRHRRVSDERARIQALGQRERKRASEEEGGTERGRGSGEEERRSVCLLRRFQACLMSVCL